MQSDVKLECRWRTATTHHESITVNNVPAGRLHLCTFSSDVFQGGVTHIRQDKNKQDDSYRSSHKHLPPHNPFSLSATSRFCDDLTRFGFSLGCSPTAESRFEETNVKVSQKPVLVSSGHIAQVFFEKLWEVICALL